MLTSQRTEFQTIWFLLPLLPRATFPILNFMDSSLQPLPGEAWWDLGWELKLLLQFWLSRSFRGRGAAALYRNRDGLRVPFDTLHTCQDQHWQGQQDASRRKDLLEKEDGLLKAELSKYAVLELEQGNLGNLGNQETQCNYKAFKWYLTMELLLQLNTTENQKTNFALKLPKTKNSKQKLNT